MDFVISEHRNGCWSCETGFEVDFEVQITFSAMAEFVSHCNAVFSAITKIKGDFGV